MYPDIPLYAVVEDICASGGYYVAAGGRQDLRRQGQHRRLDRRADGRLRLYRHDGEAGRRAAPATAGENKGFLDPFSPIDPTQKAYAKQMLDEIHQQFIRVVREGRGKRLKETPEMFSGLVWTGEKSIELGLADGLGSVESVARDVIKAEDIVDFTQREGLAERLAGRLGATMAKAWFHSRKPVSCCGERLPADRLRGSRTSRVRRAHPSMAGFERHDG